VNVAMRLQQAALPGETLLGAPTQALLGEGAEVEPIEPIDAGGSHDPIQAFRLLAVDEATPLRGLSSAAFIGRQGELESLETAFRAVRDERRSRTLIVLGEAGLGRRARIGVRRLARRAGHSARRPLRLLRRGSDIPPTRRDRSAGCPRTAAGDD
jgi:hypothetical protein